MGASGHLDFVLIEYEMVTDNEAQWDKYTERQTDRRSLQLLDLKFMDKYYNTIQVNFYIKKGYCLNYRSKG